MSNLTPSEIKGEMLDVKIPWFVGFAEKFWLKIGRFLIPIGILAYVPLGIIHNSASMSVALSMWGWMLGWGAFLFACGLLMLGSHLVEKVFVTKQAKRLGITVWIWNMYAKELDLRSNKK